MKNLNKENYFTPEWVAKYPKASKLFCEWIDQFKVKVGWSAIFQTIPWSTRHNRPATKEDYATHERGEIVPHQWKFHDLPLEIQIGIISQFMIETSKGFMWLGRRQNLENSIRDMNYHFQILEETGYERT